MTAVTTHRSLPDRLQYLLAEVGKVADSGAATAAFAAALALHLERALCEATVMAAEIEALRADAARLAEVAE